MLQEAVITFKTILINLIFKNYPLTQPRLPVLSIFLFVTVAGKDFDGGKEAYNNEEWKERVDKWKTKQEKRGLFTKADDARNDQDDDEEVL